MPRTKKAPAEQLSDQKPPMGRPPIAPEEKRISLIKVLTTAAEYAEIEQAAKADGAPISVWLRIAGLKMARHEAK